MKEFTRSTTIQLDTVGQASRHPDPSAHWKLMISLGRNRYRYCLDADDVITSVSEAWLGFARENGAAELTREYVVGRSLWGFIRGDTTRLLYQQLIQRVRETGTRIVIPFRCDSPTVRREMRLEVKLRQDATVQLDGLLVSVKPRSYLAMLDPRVPRSTETLTMCSCCKKVLVESVGWLQLEQAVVLLDCLEADTGPRLRYTLCPDCAHILSGSGPS